MTPFCYQRSLPSSGPLDLRVLVHSHGWFDLPPFSWDEERSSLTYTFSVEDGTAVSLRIRKASPKRIVVTVSAFRSLDAAEIDHAVAVACHCLQLDRDLSSFYDTVRSVDRFDWVRERGAGRLLRSATVFEDLMKVLATTNCSWGLTRVMTAAFVESYGAEAPEGRAFPRPSDLRDISSEELRAVARVGYRADYFRSLINTACECERHLSWLESTNEDETRAFLERLPGFGPYATDLALRLLGHYRGLAMDAWCRAEYARRFPRRKQSVQAIRSYYSRYGEWAGLALWLDLTAHWHGDATISG